MKKFNPYSDKEAIEAATFADFTLNSFVIHDHRGDELDRLAMEFLISIKGLPSTYWVKFIFVEDTPPFSAYCRTHKLDRLLMDVRDYNRSVHASKHSTVSENPQPLQLGSLEYPFMSTHISLENQLIIQEQSQQTVK